MKTRFLLAGNAARIVWIAARIVWIAALLLMPCCRSEPERASFRIEAVRTPKEIEPYEIIGHKAESLGDNLPLWIDMYLEEGNRGVEALPGFENKYAFVSVNTGSSQKLLERWVENFSIAQNFARLAAVRIEERFSGTGQYYPDDEYGSFFALMVKAASDHIYPEATVEDTYWIKRQFPGGEETEAREDYSYLVLSTIDKSLLEQNIRDILNQIYPVPPPSREQTAAINRMKENFFNGF